MVIAISLGRVGLRPMLWTGNWCPAQRRKLAAYPQPHSREGRREEHSILSPTPVFLNSPSPPPHPTLPQLLCLRRWDHFDLAFVTAVRRTAETKQTQKNWNPPHISGLIYLFVDLSHWLPPAELATWLHPRVRGGQGWLTLLHVPGEGGHIQRQTCSLHSLLLIIH